MGARARQELVIFAVAIAVGLFIVPGLTWTAGHFTLGPYAHGGPLPLLSDYFNGLAHGSLVFWAVALGPYLMITLWRLFYGLARRSPSGEGN